MPRLIVGTLVAALTASACYSFAPSLRPRGTAAPGLPTTADAIGASRGVAGRDTTLLGRPRDRATPIAGDRGQLDVRRVCRTSSFPRGYIAVSYEGGSGDCPRVGSDSAATVAVIVNYANAAYDTRLDICADQPVPLGWSTVRDESPSDPGACPSAVRKGDTVLRIRRDS